MNLAGYINELKVLFPQDDMKVVRFFAGALLREEQAVEAKADGDPDKANELFAKADDYLDKAISAEETT